MVTSYLWPGAGGHVTQMLIDDIILSIPRSWELPVILKKLAIGWYGLVYSNEAEGRIATRGAGMARGSIQQDIRVVADGLNNTG